MEETRKYKQTELGLLPEDWEVAKLGQIGELAMCKRIFQNETSEMGDIPFYKIGTFGKTADAYISYAKYNEFKSAYRFPNKGDILISAAGTIGRIVVYDGKPAYFQDSNIVWLAHNGKAIRNDFLFYVYQIIDWNTEDRTIARLYNDNFKKTIIPLPHIEEQRRIASTLTCVDNLLDSLDRLIAKKRDMKQGAMQQLLSGKKRLKEFTDPWEEKKLGDVVDVKRGVRVVKGQLVENGFFPVFQNTNIPLGYYNKNNVKAGTPFVIIGGSAGQIGICETNYWAADDCAYFDCGETMSNNFLYFFLLYNQREIKSNVRNASVPRLDKKVLHGLHIFIPSLSEQQAIASVLTSMNNELSALEAKRKKYEQIKQGMMQQLLTGKIRLIS